MTKKQVQAPALSAVEAYRERQRKEGAQTLYCMLSAEDRKNLDAIKVARVVNNREAVSTALRIAAREVTRKR